MFYTVLVSFLIPPIFQVKRPGDKNVRCSILLLLDHQPLQFKLDQRLARLLGIHTQTRPVIISALWQYIKTHKLQVGKTNTHHLIRKLFALCDDLLNETIYLLSLKVDPLKILYFSR